MSLRFGRLLARCLLLLGLLPCAPALVWAHLMPAQQGSLHLVDRAVFVAVALPISSLQGMGDIPQGGITSAQFQSQTLSIQAQLVQRFQLWDGNQTGRLDFVQTLAEPDLRSAPHVNRAPPEALEEGTNASPPLAADLRATHFLALMKFSFDAAPQALRLQTDLFGRSPTEQQLTFKATRGADTEAVVLTQRHTMHQFFRTPLQVFGDYVQLGMEHILMGADHLLFLLTIIVAGARWRYWLGMLTAFTVAHSLTLTAALLDWVRVAPALVEPLIAASIVLMALLNLRQANAMGWHRAVLVFACGLLHGLGFASSMAGMGLHGTYRFTSIVGFNLGIELGQGMFLLLLLGLAQALRCLPYKPEFVWPHLAIAAFPLARLASVTALLVGAFWLVERLQ